MRNGILLLLVLLAGCMARPLLTKPETEQHRLQSRVIEQAVREQAVSGDWLVTRGYHATDNLVANATGIPISHVGVYDGETGTVIEAEGKGVHASTLTEFVDKSHRLLIIRPRWQTEANAAAALANARALVGKSYDFLGTVGFDWPSKYYCSELAISIYQPWHRGREKFPTVIKPGELYLYGRVLYDSLPRDEMEPVAGEISGAQGSSLGVQKGGDP